MDPVDAMEQALDHVYYEDRANAAMHCATVKFSPLTFRLAEALANIRPSNPRVAEVMSHRGHYAEDPGR